MEIIENNSELLPAFRRPLRLLSLGFFNTYIGILTGIPVLALTLIAPSIAQFPVVKYIPFICSIFFILLSFIGVILLARAMKACSFPWKSAIPLIMIFCIVIVSEFLSTGLVIAGFQKLLNNVFTAGIYSIPLGTACLLNGLKQSGSDNAEINKIQILSIAIGLSGLFIALLGVYSTLTYVPPITDPRSGHMYDLSPLDLVTGPLELLCGLFLIPIIGVKIFQLGNRYGKTRPVDSEAVLQGKP